MLRRSKIQHYRDVESLAIAIGDLRYDAIEELLGLLAIKLRADSILKIAGCYEILITNLDRSIN